MKKMYFAETGAMTNPRNLAEKAVQEYAREVDATLVYGDEARNSFIENFKEKVKEINTKYPRCRPMSAYTWNHGFSEISVSLCVDGVTQIEFNEVKHEFPAQPK